MSDSHQTAKSSASPVKKSTPATPQLDQPDVEMEIGEEQEMMDMSVMQRAHASPQSLKPPEVMQLQRLVGNRAVNRLLGGGGVRRKSATPFEPRSEAEAYRAPKAIPIQPARYQESSPHQPAYARLRHLPIQAKLTVGPVADEYEKEADRVANQVMSMPSQPVATQREAAQDDMQMKPLVQRQLGDETENEDEMQMKPLQPNRLVTLQRYGSDGQEAMQLKRLPSVMRYGSDEKEQAQMKPLSIQRLGGEEDEMQLKRLIQREVEVRGRKPKTVQRIAPLLLALIPMILPMVMPMIQQMLPQLLGGLGGGGGGGMGDLMGMVGSMAGGLGGGGGGISRKPLIQRNDEDEMQMKSLVQRNDEDEMQMKPLVQRDDEDEMQMKPLQPNHLVTLQRYRSDGQEAMQLKRLPSVMRYGSDGEEQAQMKPLSIQRLGGEEDEMQLKRLIQREVEVRGRKPKTVQRIAPLLLALIPMILPMVMPMIQQMLPQLLGGLGGGGGGMGDLMGMVGSMAGGLGGGGGGISRKPIVQRSPKRIQREANPLPNPDTMANIQGGLKGSNVVNSEGANPGGVMQRFQGVMSSMNSMLGGLGGMLGGGANAQMGSGGAIGGLMQLKRKSPKTIQRVGAAPGGGMDMLGGAMSAITGAMSGSGGGDDKNLSGMLQRFDGMIGGLGGMLTGLSSMMGGMTGGIQPKSSVQREFDGSFQTTSNFETRLHSANMSGNPLPETIRRELEPKFGADFSHVRIHTDSQAVQLNREVQARAFTHGSHIHFGAGEYNPGTSAGKSLLAHELTHVVQQTGARQISPKRMVRLQRKPLPLMQREVEVKGRKPKTVQRFLPLLMGMLPMLLPMIMPMLSSMMGGMMGGGGGGGLGGMMGMMGGGGGGLGGMMGGMMGGGGGGLGGMMGGMMGGGGGLGGMMGGMGGMMGGIMREPANKETKA